jgi:hypothetical protein
MDDNSWTSFFGSVRLDVRFSRNLQNVRPKCDRNSIYNVRKLASCLSRMQIENLYVQLV